MASPLPPDTAGAGWLQTVGVGSRCQWDVLVFLSRHQRTLLGVAALARLLGSARQAMVVALDVLDTLHLVERSRISQGARLSRCLIPQTGPRREAFAPLLALAAARAGRVGSARQVRRDHTPTERGDQAQRVLVEAQARLQEHRRAAQDRAERRPRWLPAI